MKRACNRRGGLALLLLAGLVGLTGCGGREEEARPEEELPTLVIAYPGAEEDAELIGEAFSEITQRELGIRVELAMLERGSYSEVLGRKLANQEQIDICYMGSDLFLESCAKNRLTELSGLLEEYGADIRRETGDAVIDVCRMSGELYGLPGNHDFASGWDSYVLNRDILERNGIDYREIKTYADLEEVFALVHEREPKLCIVQSGAGTMSNNVEIFSGNIPMMLLKETDGEEQYVCLCETEEYRQFLERVRGWYLKGYMSRDVVGETEGFLNKMKAGRLLAYSTVGKPGIQKQEEQLTGKNVAVIQLGDTSVSSGKIARLQWVIPKNTVDAATSMRLMNLMYSSRELMNLLAYGVEGVHYARDEEGFLKNREGSENPYAAYAWQVPNQFITDVWEGEPKEVWEELRRFNAEARQVPDFGFRMDLREVYPEYCSLQEVYGKYRIILENGMVDPQEGCESMMRELEACGLKEFTEECNRQWREWSKTKSRETSD